MQKQVIIVNINARVYAADWTDPVSASFGINAPGRLEGLLGADWGADILRWPIICLPLDTTDAFNNHHYHDNSSSSITCRLQLLFTHSINHINDVTNVMAIQSDNAGRIWCNARVWKCIDLQSDETCWFSVRLASRVTPKAKMLSEKRIWEPAIVSQSIY